MIKVKVCIGSACHLKGSYNVINNLQELIEQHKVTDKVDLSAAFCLGKCTKAVSVQIDDAEIFSVGIQNTKEFFVENVLSRI